MNLIFELPKDSALLKNYSRYLIKYNASYNDTRVPGGIPIKLLYSSERIWEESEHGVRYTKNKHGVYLQVDLKEFMWIKLKCQEV